jgi:hypothetical protein
MTISRRVPWLRIGAESVAVIVSILLAFAIDAWWNERIETQQEREQLFALRADFQASLDGLNQTLTDVKSLRADIEELASLLKVAGNEPVQVAGYLLGSAISWRTSDVSMSTLDALMASGRLNLLSDPELRAKLAGFPAVLSDVTEDEELGRDFAESRMLDFMVREGLADYAYSNRRGFEDFDVVSTETSALPSTELIGLLAARRVHLSYSQQGLMTVQDYLEDLIDAIDQELLRSDQIETFWTVRE